MSTQQKSVSVRVLDVIERVGNRLPDPVTLFVLGAGLVLVVSEIAARGGWHAIHPETNERFAVTSLLSAEGFRWVWRNMVTNFTGFAPLGVVLVGMLGIGVAERSGLIGALLKLVVQLTPRSLLTPGMLFAGVMSSLALDAGYVVLPPLAAAVYYKAGRSPLVGLAVVIAGISAGFSANLVITGLDPLLQSFTQAGAHLLDENRVVDVRCNYYFMIVSTFMITLVGWAVTRFVVEPRFRDAEIVVPEALANAEAGTSDRLSKSEGSGLLASLIALAVAGGGVLALVLVPGAALNGQVDPKPGWSVDVWVLVIVPILFVLFLVPGIAYGVVARTIRSDRDVAAMMGDSMKSMGSYIVLAFFAGQFVAWFGESGLGTVCALKGVEFIEKLGLSSTFLVVAIVVLSAGLNLFIGSASGKWALISPVFVPVFMGAGIRPELTQAAYRVGDSVTNCIAPLNPYMVIMLVFLRQYAPKAGLGSLVALMLPYSIALFAVWIVLLLVWMGLGIPLGPGDVVGK